MTDGWPMWVRASTGCRERALLRLKPNQISDVNDTVISGELSNISTR
jgi:hypothetical protein